MVGLTNAAGEGIWGSSRLDTAGNPLSPCSCDTTWLHYFMSHTRELEKQVLCKGRGEWGLRADALSYPTKEIRATWWRWPTVSIMMMRAHAQGKNVLPLKYRSRLETENMFSRLVKLRPRSPKVFLQRPWAHTSCWSAQNLCQATTGHDGCLNPVIGWPVSTHYAA